MITRILLVLVAGAVGALANSLGLWLSGVLGVSQSLHFSMTPPLTPGFILPRLLPGALWGLLFLIPILPGRPFLKGLLLSLPPAAFMIFVFFGRMGYGHLGANLGPTAPYFALALNIVWGLTAAAFLKRTTGRA